MGLRPAPGRRAIVVGCVLMLGLAGVALIWCLADGASNATATPATALGPGFAPGLVASSAARPASRVAPMRAQQAHGADDIEVCGGTWIGRLAAESIDAVRSAMHWPDSRDRVLAGLAADRSDMARAASLVITMMGDDLPHRQAALNGPPLPDVTAARDALAQMALSTADPAVYALAFNVCGNHREGACQLLSAEQWARLDDGNAAPWFYILSAADEAGDRAAVDEALHRIATAQRSEVGFGVIPGVVVDHAPGDDSSMSAAVTMAIDINGFEAAWSLPSYLALTRACKGDALRDANRQQTCAAIAELLVDHSNTLIEARIGVSVGEHVGWPAERADALRGEYAAFIAADQDFYAGAQPLACATIRHDLDRLRQRAAIGEAGAFRQWVSRSGKSAGDFAREQRTLAREAEARP